MWNLVKPKRAMRTCSPAEMISGQSNSKGSEEKKKLNCNSDSSIKNSCFGSDLLAIFKPSLFHCRLPCHELGPCRIGFGLWESSWNFFSPYEKWKYCIEKTWYSDRDGHKVSISLWYYILDDEWESENQEMDPTSFMRFMYFSKLRFGRACTNMFLHVNEREFRSK